MHIDVDILADPNGVLRSVLRRDTEMSRYAELGVPAEIADALIRVRAPARHVSRVRAAIAAALVTLEEQGHDINEQFIETRAAAVLLQALTGAGGHHGLGIPRPESRRPGVFCELGKGRRYASDGPAWNVAIETAFWWVVQSARASPRELVLAPAPDGTAINIVVVEPNRLLHNEARHHEDAEYWREKLGADGFRRIVELNLDDLRAVPVPAVSTDREEALRHWRALAGQSIMCTTGMWKSTWFVPVGSIADWTRVFETLDSELKNIRAPAPAQESCAGAD
ncbi:MAG: hypothetical protein N3G75_06740 [Methanothrix sp.]|nr:hypothetical protein [Methanothrix sp.]MCX8207513.1 hypothetical protein [Methanothrix sp.]